MLETSEEYTLENTLFAHFDFVGYTARNNADSKEM